MAISPQPPRPPSAPPPPHTGSHVLAIILLILAMIVAASVAAIWFGVRLLQQNIHVQVTEQVGKGKEVQIQTPVGNMEVRKGEEATEAQLGLPFYPGATRVEDEHDPGSVGLSFKLPDQNDVRIYVATFQTPDALSKVRDFYRQQLGGRVTKCVEKQSQGKTVLEIKHHDQDRIVALEPREGGTRIALVRVLRAHAEAN